MSISLILDPVTSLNLVFTSAILILSIWVFKKKGEKLGLNLCIGFGLFALSHALTLLGFGDVKEVILPLRALGYLVIIVGLCISLLKHD